MAPEQPKSLKSSGSFEPPPPQFCGVISTEPTSEFPAEPDRYVLFIHFGCPFAHRTNIVYHLKRLQPVIGLSVVSIHRDPGNGSWQYDGSNGSDESNSIYDLKNLKQLYEKADPAYQGTYSVPVLWDSKKETIVSNDSHTILRMLYSSFDAFLAPELREVNKPGGGLLPDTSRESIDELNRWVQDDVNWGTYKCGFAKTQEDYDEAMKHLFERLDELEERLGGQTYLFGDHITEADILLFPTMVRFDMAYVTIFHCNWKQIRYDYPNLHRWLRQLYWEVDEETKGAFKTTTHFDIFMEGYANAAMKQKLVPWGPSVPILPLEA